MRRFLLSLSFLPLLGACGADTDAAAPDRPSTSGSASPDADATETHIRAAFAALQVACRERDAAAARDLLAAPTVTYWKEVRELALHARRDALRAEGLAKQLAVLVVRGLTAAESLRDLDATGTIDLALQRGLVGGAFVQGNELADVAIDGDRAQSGAVREGEPLQVRYGFAREDGAWRVDLVPAYEMADQILRARFDTLPDQDEEEGLYLLVGQATGSGGSEALWEPLAAPGGE